MFSKDRLRCFLIGGFVAGLLDITYAIVYSYLRAAVPPARVLQSVASGLLGRPAYQGGAPVATLGLVLHFLIAYLAAATYFLAARRFRMLVERPFVSGLIFGAGVFATMNLVIVPLSRFPGQLGRTPLTLITGLLVHMFLIGLPIAYAARKAYRDA